MTLAGERGGSTVHNMGREGRGDFSMREREGRANLSMRERGEGEH